MLESAAKVLFTVVEYPPGDAAPNAAVAALLASMASLAVPFKLPWNVVAYIAVAWTDVELTLGICAVWP